MSLATAIFLWILFLDTALIILVVDQDTPSEESPDCCRKRPGPKTGFRIKRSIERSSRVASPSPRLYSRPRSSATACAQARIGMGPITPTISYAGD